MRITVSMPCFGRPQRTIRAIECIFNQNINNWEALVVGDGCQYMSDFIISNYFGDMVREANKNGNSLQISNMTYNHGGWGYFIINKNIHRALGKYFIFMSNDDVILPNHFQNYLSGIEGTDLDYAYFNSFLKPTGQVRVSELKNGSIGHSEIIVRTDFLRTLAPHTPEYGHDWYMIREMIEKGKGRKMHNHPLTYSVRGVGELRQDEID